METLVRDSTVPITSPTPHTQSRSLKTYWTRASDFFSSGGPPAHGWSGRLEEGAVSSAPAPLIDKSLAPLLCGDAIRQTVKAFTDVPQYRKRNFPKSKP
eukprot:277155-Prorocentrum_minimum.AAC.2